MTFTEHGTNTVYRKTRWADEWEEVEHAHAVECTWSASPAMPTASVVWHYGRIAQHGEEALQDVERKFVAGSYIKIVFETQGHSYVWYGISKTDADEVNGTDSHSESGRQVFTCFGLEDALKNSPIYRSLIDPGQKIIPSAIEFNAGGEPNKATHVDLFATDPVFLSFWSSQAIADYTLEHDVASDETGVQAVQVELHDPDQITFLWDKPRPRREGANVASLLDSIYPRGRFVGWRMRVLNDTDWRVAPFSYALSDVALNPETGDTLPANSVKRNINLDDDHDARIAVKRTLVGRYDQTIVRGAKATSTLTLRMDDSPAILVRGWSHPSLTNEYNDGASNQAGYGAWTLLQQIVGNIAIRTRERLADVFTKFEIKADWDGKVGTAPLDTDVFPYVDSAADETGIYNLTLQFARQLPFKENVDYSVTFDSLDESDAGDRLATLVLWELPEDADNYVHVERMGQRSGTDASDDENHRWSADVSLIGRGIRLTVDGQHKHVVADGDFTPLSIDQDLGDNDYMKHLVVTCCIEADAYCQAVFPANEDLPSKDHIRRQVISLGDSYRLDYVVGGTAFGIKDDGELDKTLFSDYLQDDRESLEAIATAMHQWANTERRVVEFSSSQFFDVNVGDLIETLGTADNTLTVNTVATSVRITWPDEGDDLPRLHVTTQSAELDADRLTDLLESTFIPLVEEEEP